jgi:hypothetical protein
MNAEIRSFRKALLQHAPLGLLAALAIAWMAAGALAWSTSGTTAPAHGPSVETGYQSAKAIRPYNAAALREAKSLRRQAADDRSEPDPKVATLPAAAPCRASAGISHEGAAPWILVSAFLAHRTCNPRDPPGDVT